MDRVLLFFTLLFLANVEAKYKHGTYYEGGKKIGTADDFFQFRTRPDLLAPRWNISIYDRKALAPGYLFVAPYKNLKQMDRGEAWIGPHIYDQDGELVWSGAPTYDHFKAFDIRLAKVNGTDMMTAMYPHEVAATIMDKHYQIVDTVHHSDAWEYTNMHDFNVVENGKRALVLTKDAATRVSRKKSKAVGFDGECLVRGDGMKYLDITVSPPEVLLEWNGTNHIGLDEVLVHVTNTPIEELCNDGTKWDIYHLNSVDIFPDGDFLVSSRSTSALFKISHKTGKVVWRLGGKKSDFDFGPGGRFNFQHHARVHSQNRTHSLISLMDNSKSDAETDEYTPRDHSAGIILSLDEKAMKAELVKEYPYPHGGYVNKRGSAHVLPNGNVLMGWAYNVFVSEHAPDGRLLMEGSILPALDSYRSYKYEWVGEPLDPPDVYSAAFLSGETTWTMAYVSWNGATEVAKWALYAVGANGRIDQEPLVIAKRRGFETELAYEGFVERIIVEALDKHGKVIGKSKVVSTTPVTSVDAGVDSPADDTIDQSADTSLPHDIETTHEPIEQSLSPVPDLYEAGNEYDAEENTSWAETITKSHIIAFVSALSGFMACALLGLLIWALRKFRTKPLWHSEKTRYAALSDTNEDDGREMAEMERDMDAEDVDEKVPLASK